MGGWFCAESEDLQRADNITKFCFTYFLMISTSAPTSFSFYITYISNNTTTRGQFQQHFMHSFYVCRSQKAQKKSIRWSSYLCFLWSLYIKAARKHVDKIDPRTRLRSNLAVILHSFVFRCRGPEGWPSSLKIFV